MALRNRNPSEPRRSDQPIKRIISQFNGMISGEPDTKIPANYCKKNTNLIDRGGYSDVRGGSNKYSDTRFVHAIYMMNPVYTDDFTFVDAWYSSGKKWGIGDSFRFVGSGLPDIVGGGSFDTETDYYIRNTSGSGIIEPGFSIHPTYEDAIANTNAIKPVWIYGGVVDSRPVSWNIAWNHVYVCDHVKAGKLIIIDGGTVYVASKAIGVLESVLTSVNIGGEVSAIIPYGDNAIIASKTEGIFKLILTDTFYYMIKINCDPPNVLIPDIGYSVSLTFGYLYTHSLCRITGTGNRNRISDAVLLQQETGTCNIGGSEKDYGEVYFSTGVGKILTEQHIIGGAVVDGSLGGISISYELASGKTHIGLYRTKDIGPAGSSPTAASVGNGRDQLVWVDDIPICKSIIIDTTTVGHAKIISGNKFVLGDVGSVMRLVSSDGFPNISYAIITGWVSEDDVLITRHYTTVLPIPSHVNCFATIGGDFVGKGSQSNVTGENIITMDNSISWNSTLTVGEIGDILFISDGTIRTIYKRSGSGGASLKYYVKEDGNFVGLAVSQIYVNCYRSWNDTIPDAPQADGRVSLQDRIEYGTDLYIPRRFFVPMPNCDILYMSNGFLMGAVRDSGEYFYCQTGDKEYTIGHYKYPEQSRKVSSAIQQIVGMLDRAIVLMKSKSGIVTLSSSINIGRTEVGENIYQLPEIGVVDENKGVIAWKIITFKNANILFSLTSDGAFRYFDGYSWSAVDLGFVNGLDAVSKEYLKRIDHSAAYGANYNSNGGIKLWAKRIVDGVSEDICLRFATDANEGQGWSIIEGTHWVEPMESFGVFTILDDNGVQRCLVIDKNDHYIYEIDTFDRITRERKYVLDKTGVQNAEVTWSKRLREEIVDIGSQNKKLKHQQAYVNVMPEYVEDRGETGYTATGIRDAQELTLKAFEDGEQTTAAAQTDDFPEDGELVYSGRRVKASRISTELSGTAGEIQITGIVNEFLVEPGPSADKRINTESNLEEELNQDLIYHACRANIDRVSGDSLGVGVSFITGPDGRSRSGMTFTGVRSISISGSTHTILLWSKDTNLFTGIAGFTAYGVAVAGWTLYYKKTVIGTATIELMAGSKSDIRIYDKTISDAAIADLYADTVNFEGRRHLPGFRTVEDL